MLVRAVIQWKRGELTAAAASLRDVLAFRPDDVEAHCLMAEVLLAQHQNEPARRHFEQALQIDPNCTWASLALQSLG
jgi:Tfp pilus assembly protein PilF